MSDSQYNVKYLLIPIKTTQDTNSKNNGFLLCKGIKNSDQNILTRSGRCFIPFNILSVIKSTSNIFNIKDSDELTATVRELAALNYKKDKTFVLNILDELIFDREEDAELYIETMGTEVLS